MSEQQKSGYAAILLAAKRGDVGKIRALLDGAAPVLYAIDSAVTSALFTAAERGHVECVREMLSHGVNTTTNYPRGETLLMAAVGSPECVALALAAGVDVDARTIEGWSAFDIAIERGSAATIPLLVSAGATWPEGALLRAVRSGRAECAKALIEAGADVNAQDHDGCHPLGEAALLGYAQCIEILLDAGADVDFVSSDVRRSRSSALGVAASNGLLGCVRNLLAGGATVDLENHFGQTPLMGAAARGHLQVVRALLRANADVNHVTEYGWTAAKSAFWTGRTQMLDLLLKAGAELPDMDFVLKTIRSKRDAQASQAECLVFMVKKGLIDQDKIMRRLRRYKGGIAHQALAMIESETIAKLSAASRGERSRHSYAHV